MNSYQSDFPFTPLALSDHKMELAAKVWRIGPAKWGWGVFDEDGFIVADTVSDGVLLCQGTAPSHGTAMRMAYDCAEHRRHVRKIKTSEKVLTSDEQINIAL